MRAMAALAAVLTAGALVSGTAAPAAACACGGIVSSDLGARVTGEQALLAMNGRTETIVMRLDVESVADNAALIVPTPTPATVTATGPGLFPELERLTAPRVETGPRAEYDTAVAAGAPVAPTVVAQVQLGPLEATTLTGGDLTGVRRWLDSHGYAMRPEVSAQLEPYLRQDWSFVAMRLTGNTPLSGQLDPVRMDFASDRMVYPMRMSAAAKDTQRVVIYTLGPHRMQRDDADAARQDVTLDFAGVVDGPFTDPTLTELGAANRYLTRISTTITDPAAITADFSFAEAPTDDPYRRVIGPAAPAEPGIPGGVIAGVTTVAVLAIAGAVGVVLLIFRRKTSGQK
ncbi:MAG TPA: DUF2330 domain-containing protein [Mycobacterium sp.]|nr:DUF2330 domain-containing protein [Mycobacterium sp.]